MSAGRYRARRMIAAVLGLAVPRPRYASWVRLGRLWLRAASTAAGRSPQPVRHESDTCSRRWLKSCGKSLWRLVSPTMLWFPLPKRVSDDATRWETVMEPPPRGHASLLRSRSSQPEDRGADAMPVIGAHGRVPHRMRGLHHRRGRGTLPRRGEGPTTSVSSAGGLLVSASHAWSWGTSGSGDRGLKTGPLDRSTVRAQAPGRRWAMALQDHARHDDHDTGSTHPSSRHRSRALRSTTRSTRSCSGVRRAAPPHWRPVARQTNSAKAQ